LINAGTEIAYGHEAKRASSMVAESVSRRHEMPVEQVAEDDYQSFCEALSSTARGRAFLQEFARRNRQADTEIVLTALERLEATARAHSPEADRIRQDLKALLDTLRSARPQTENTPTAIKAATLAALIDFTQARIEALVLPAAAREGEALAAVPAEEQPELPIPHPTAAAPLMSLVQEQIRIEPVASAPQPLFPAQAKRKTATIIPIVEFDYRAFQNGRPLTTRHAPEESWTTLTPPFIATPALMQPLPAVATPESSTLAAEAKTETKSEVTAETSAAVETYELWLDPPAVAMAEPEMATGAVVQTTLPEAAAIVEATPETVAPQTASQATMPELAIAETEVAVTEVAVTDVITDVAIAEPAATVMVSVDLASAEAASAPEAAEATRSTIDTVMGRIEQAAAPAPAIRGHAEADPLAPLMALSDEERIALFT